MLSLLVDCLFDYMTLFQCVLLIVFVGATFGGIKTGVGGEGANCSLGWCMFGGHGMVCGVWRTVYCCWLYLICLLVVLWAGCVQWLWV
jgi:hypothetical protein